MADLTKVNISANEIMKEADFTYGETREVENLSTLLGIMLDLSTGDVIFSGGTVKERGTPSMNVDIDPVLAFIRSTVKLVHSGSLFGPVAIDNGDASARIDVVEVQLVETDFDSQQRAFKDPATGEVTFQDQNTKTRYELQAQVIKGTPGSGIAPSHTAGWIKLAEVNVDALESTAIYDADIENCTGGKEGEVTINWTSETSTTFVLKSLSDIKTILRAKHLETGDHGDDVIQGQHVDWGVAANQVDADLMPLGTAITHAPTGGTAAGLTSGSLVRAAVQKILDLLIDLSGVQNDAVRERHIDLGIDAGDVDADVLPLGTAVTSSPTGGTATNLVNTSFVRAAIQEAFNRLRDLSGVQNDAVVNRHIGALAIRQAEIDLGVDAGDLDADVLPLGTIVASTPTGGTATNLAAASFVRAALQLVFDRFIALAGVQNDAVDSRHYAANSIDEEHLNWGTGAGQIGLLKGHSAIVLTNYAGTGVPQIAAGGSCEINGQLYTNPSAITITGTTVDDTWYEILLIPSGTTYTASYITRGTGVWSDSKQGLYSGNNRVIAVVRRLTSIDFRNKNILNIQNRRVTIQHEIGGWDMDTNAAKTLHFVWDEKQVRDVAGVIRVDPPGEDDTLFSIPGGDASGGSALQLKIGQISSFSTTLIRVTDSPFDSTTYDDDTFNRGWIQVLFEV